MATVSLRTVALQKALSQQGVTEAPANTNNVQYWDWWGNQDGAVQSWEILGAWCAAFVSWAFAEAGAPLPEMQKAGRPGFVGVPIGTAWAINHGETVQDPQPGDIVIYSWYPITWDNGYPWVWYGGQWVIAGDHVGIVDHIEGNTVWSIEGNTSVNASQDNGGAVLLRNRPMSQVAVFWRPSTGTIDVSQINAGGFQPASVPPVASSAISTVLEDNSMIHEATKRPTMFNYEGVDWEVHDIYHATIDGTVLPGGKVAQHSALVIAPLDPGTAAGGQHVVHVFKSGERVNAGKVEPFFGVQKVTLAQYGAWVLTDVAGRWTVLARPHQPVHVFVREISYLV